VNERKPTALKGAKPGRNAPCPCGSGRKYKYCCADKEQQPIAIAATPPATADLRMAAQLRRAGRVAESVIPMERAARLNPTNPILQHDLGLTYLECRRVADAISCFHRAVSLWDGFGHAHYRLGIALQLQGRVEEAILAYRRALTRSPSLSDAAVRLGSLLLGRGRRKEASDAFRLAATIEPDAVVGWLSLTRALLIENQDAEAETTVRHALALDPRSSAGHSLLGTILAESGRFDEAVAEFNQSIVFNPQQGATYYDLVRCHPITEAARPLIDQMLRVTGTLRQPEELEFLHLAIGKAFDDLENFGAAMEHFAEANRIRKMIAPFDRDSFARRINETIAHFTPGFFAAHREAGSTSQLPLIILGMPRSGTTLVEQIVSSHHQVAGAGELHFWTQRNAEFEHAGTDAQIRDFQLRVARDCISRLRDIAPDAARVTDKMPFNFLRAGLIHLVLPRATIIHCRRNPLDTCLSIFTTYFAPRPDFSADRDDLVFYYRHYLRLMAHWRSVLPPQQFIEVDYEALIADAEPVSRKLIASCGLQWDPACLHPERNNRVVKTASKWQARQPIYTTAIERWRRYEPWLGEFRQLLPV
jgi:tetratricopeptide (TPR) repeat protein